MKPTDSPTSDLSEEPTAHQWIHGRSSPAGIITSSLHTHTHTHTRTQTLTQTHTRTLVPSHTQFLGPLTSGVRISLLVALRCLLVLSYLLVQFSCLQRTNEKTQTFRCSCEAISHEGRGRETSCSETRRDILVSVKEPGARWTRKEIRH